MKRNAKPSSGGSSSGRGSRLRLTLLLATAAAFLLVPAAQAFAAEGTTILKVNLAGTASGEVSSFAGGGETFEGVPPIECSNVSGEEKTVCEDKLSLEGFLPEFEAILLNAIAPPGSIPTGWTIEGAPLTECPEPYNCLVFVETGTVAEVEVTATFKPAFPLKLEKTTTNGGGGTVVSNPAGISCLPGCPNETAKFEAGKEVVLTASAAEDSVFTSWTGCSIKTEGRKCYVSMSQARTVKSKFTKVQPLTAVKDPTGTGTGTLSSSPAGIVCAPSCTKATALFTEGAASFVTVKAAPLTSTSEFDSWTECPEVVEVVKCKVAMSAAQTVEAKFKAIPQNALKLVKEGGEGTGTVTSSPAGISCGQNCSSAEASYLKTKSVTLKEVASKGSTFGGWSGDCSGLAETCTVAMSAEHNVGASFE